MRRCRARLSRGPAAWLLALAVLAQRDPAHAQPDTLAEQGGPVLVRIASVSSALRAGPGLSYRVVYRAEHGELFTLQGRAGIGYWMRVHLADGRSAFVLGDTAEVVAEGDSAASFQAPGVFAPPLLGDSWGGLTMGGGVLGGGGFAELRPAWVLSRALSLEPYVALVLRGEGRSVLYGAGAAVNLAPDWAVAPFVNLGGGGFHALANNDAFAVTNRSLFHARAGAGLLVSLRYRISFRAEAAHLVLFDADTYRPSMIYSLGLGSYF